MTAGTQLLSLAVFALGPFKICGHDEQKVIFSRKDELWARGHKKIVPSKQELSAHNGPATSVS